MKKLIFIIIFGIGWCGEHNVRAETEPYISPGLQIGFNSNKEFFYGFQLSVAMLINSKSSYINSPSICYGYKRVFNSKLNEKYIDVQIMFLPDTRGNIDEKSMNAIPIGLGIGIDFSGDKKITRIKGYSWLFACITLDYNIKRKLFNTSLIPVFPIAAMM